MAEIRDKTTPEEFTQWIAKEGFGLLIDVVNNSGGQFGAPLLIALDKDLSAHHAIPLRFWSVQNKDKSMELLRALIRKQGFSAVALAFKASVTMSDVEKSALMLVTSIKDGQTKLYIKTIEEDGSLSDTIVEENPSGRMVKFWYGGVAE